jgi:phosphoribosyl 1,2-cyclic phosphate phosphodiesterase
MSLELLFLGSGTSAGVPMIGCDCDVCTSDDPRDNRTRASVIVRYPDADDPTYPRQILIDAAPDIRIQITRERLNHIDALLLTHAHADHIFGIDDLRRFNAVMKQPIDVHAEPDVIDTLRRMFSYIFEKHNNVNQSFVADLTLMPLAVKTSFDLHGATWTPLRLMHGKLPILGFRVDYRGASLAYCTDVSAIPGESVPLLEGVDVLVIDALRYRAHPTHMSVDQALEQVDRLRPKQTFFTHIAHDIRHGDLDGKLPDGVNLAYDGLTINVRQPARL